MTFREKLLSGKKVLTAEITPPHGTDMTHFEHIGRLLKPHFDALNVTDNQRALMRMSNLATAAYLVKMGIEPIYQLTCRDRNSLAIQSDLMGAQALGIPNVLCLTGDPVRAGHFVDAKPVFEVESVGLLKIIKAMKEGKNSAGKNLESPLQIFQGAVVNPSVANPAPQIRRMEKKLEAGANFFQTQAVFTAKTMETFMPQVAHMKAPVIAGVLLVRSLKTAKFLHEKVPGVNVPPELFEALEKAADPVQAGIEYCQKLCRELLGICQGVHLMAVKNEEALVDVVEGGKLRSLLAK